MTKATVRRPSKVTVPPTLCTAAFWQGRRAVGAPAATIPVMAHDAPAHTNRLAGETSPYLLQHAHNPVDWYPWGPEALARAKAEDRPIFLSIGYAACHWCHVMERESFEDEATAQQLNRDFVPIKVDREERPDLDQVYMSAVQAMTGGGGWPMSVFLTPGGRPFYGGTYFPNTSRHGLPSFRDVLTGVADAWRDRRAEIEESGERLAGALNASERFPVAPTIGDRTLLDRAVASLEREFDPPNGGWGRAPKFPQPMTIEFLLRRWVGSGDARALAMARRSLDRMADGGIHDQLGGGFHRYATDAIWLVPHFEKMLYDNGQLARVYTHAFQATRDRRYVEVARDTLDYLLRELRRDDGSFAASHDADTNGVEGLTFTWQADEIRSVLGADAAEFLDAYGATDRGNWEDTNILSRVTPAGDDATERRLAAAREKLLAVRAGRPQPGRDDKALGAWNGLAIAALADASRVFRDENGPRYRAAALQAAETLLAALRTPDGRLRRSWKDGRAVQDGVLEDYTHLADGLLALYEATFDERWFSAARDLMEHVLGRFADPAGGFFDTASDAEALVTRPKDLQDNALPSGNAMAATVLLRLAALTGEGRYRDAAEASLRLVAGFADRYPTGFAQWLNALDFAFADVVEVAVVGGVADPATQALLAPLEDGYRPNQVVAVAADPADSVVPLMTDRSQRDGRPTAYVCRNFACRQPVTDVEALRSELVAGAMPPGERDIERPIDIAGAAGNAGQAVGGLDGPNGGNTR
jgi:uncharacterized protein YyaL (SSP411 family)